MAVELMKKLKKNYTKIPNSILGDKNLTLSEMLVLMAVLSLKNDASVDGEILARKLNYRFSVRTIENIQRRLIAKGYLKSVQQRKSNGQFGNNDYIIVTPHFVAEKDLESSKEEKRNNDISPQNDTERDIKEVIKDQVNYPAVCNVCKNLELVEEMIESIVHAVKSQRNFTTSKKRTIPYDELEKKLKEIDTEVFTRSYKYAEKRMPILDPHQFHINNLIVNINKATKTNESKPNTSFHNFDMKHNYDFDKMEEVLLSRPKPEE